ncbi:hypothetical protein QTJ16_000823 [Diplocarpon rosae]|uniref:Uncharacterized protein n=1 Tax=Diplocarpon rosae TaxID=946125 RepID=A0AAD9WH25_9HELO|nr:hypothetical protein QTJ16_000823 [Diplocarpon rosae]
MATNPTIRALEPIPLHTLVVLLKYEFMVSDPRYRKFGLFATSLSNPAMLEANRHMFKMDGRSVASLHRFLELEKPPPDERYPAATCEPHPNAGWAVHNLSWVEKELIFQETRNHDGCYKAIGLFQYFFDWCPAEQKVLIQVPDEVCQSLLRVLICRVPWGLEQHYQFPVLLGIGELLNFSSMSETLAGWYTALPNV